MKKFWFAAVFAAGMACSTAGFAQVPTQGNAMKMVPVKDQVDMELLTWNEIYDKIHKEGKTTVVIVTGGTEQRGPQAVLGGHTIMGHNKGVEVAKKLGNALSGYTIPFSLASGAEDHPGGAGLSSDLFKAVNIAEIDNMVKNGFKTIFIMGDHGGGQNELKEVAAYEDKIYAPKGIHVAYISDFYSKSHDDFDLYCYEHHIPLNSHASVQDTSEMMYFEPVKGMYIRDVYKTMPFDPGPEPEAWKKQYDAKIAAANNPQAAEGQRGGRGGNRGAAAPPVVDANNPIWVAIQGAPAGQRGGGGDGEGGGGGRGGRGANPNAPPRVNNGSTGDPHMSSKELGKVYVNIVVNNAVNEIHKYQAQWKSGN
jgi:creatinine amidohydrolase